MFAPAPLARPAMSRPLVRPGAVCLAGALRPGAAALIRD